MAVGEFPTAVTHSESIGTPTHPDRTYGGMITHRERWIEQLFERGSNPCSTHTYGPAAELRAAPIPVRVACGSLLIPARPARPVAGGFACGRGCYALVVLSHRKTEQGRTEYLACNESVTMINLQVRASHCPRQLSKSHYVDGATRPGAL